MEKEKSELLRPAAAAAYLGVCRRTLYALAERDADFPRKVVLGRRCVGWRRESLENWLKTKEAR